MPTGAAFGIDLYDVVVLSQSCDLVAGKVELVLLAPHWSIKDVAMANTDFGSNKHLEKVRRGNVIGYHMLNECKHPGFEADFRVVDFRKAYSLPLEYLRNMVAESPQRPRLLPPYREHLAQAFARFLMRVGLPMDIPKFA